MKRSVFLCAMLFFIGAAIPVGYASVDDLHEAEIIQVEGDSEIDLVDDGDWGKAEVGDKLFEDTGIKTGRRSETRLIFDKEGLNVAEIEENTQVTIKKDMIELQNGNVVVNFENLKPGSSFIVKTPTVTCGIKGSGMRVGFKNGKTSIKAFNHNVYVRTLDSEGNPSGEESVVEEGSKAEVSEKGETKGQGKLTESEKKAFNNWVDVTKKEEKKEKKEEKAAVTVIVTEVIETEPADPETPEGSPY
ncbi:MAG: FecR domain-containing protein [Candidatus Omnitrophica bacterium]|nr:FecR domain-containing protein [Candidatus Omnitrophota bacterium]